MKTFKNLQKTNFTKFINFYFAKNFLKLYWNSFYEVDASAIHVSSAKIVVTQF